jgi:hypothetical protein
MARDAVLAGQGAWLTGRVDEHGGGKLLSPKHTRTWIAEQRLIGDDDQVRIADDAALADRLGVEARVSGHGGAAAFGPVDGRILGLQAAEEGGCAEDAAGSLDAVPAAAMEADAQHRRLSLSFPWFGTDRNRLFPEQSTCRLAFFCEETRQQRS